MKEVAAAGANATAAKSRPLAAATADRAARRDLGITHNKRNEPLSIKIHTYPSGTPKVRVIPSSILTHAMPM